MTKVLSVLLLLLCLALSSCSKASYLYNQGIGQFSLLWNSDKNNELLKDDDFPEKFKLKIRKITKYKKYFYEYFGKETTGIYSKTTILENEAVTYLLIASRYDKVKTKKFKFPLFGSFPYLGFFSKDQALDYERNLKSEGYVTYLRPVYAYSTLGYLEDRILSSFFYFDDFTLAEIIFHELFHTIFFIKDDVDLNENLANIVGKQMALEYFKDRPEIIKTKARKIKQRKILDEQVQLLTKELIGKYKDIKGSRRADYELALKRFIDKDFIPRVRKVCDELGLKKCRPATQSWNNARFAANMSYDKDVSLFEKYMSDSKLSIRAFYEQLKTEYKKYDDKCSQDISFSAHFKNKMIRKKR